MEKKSNPPNPKNSWNTVQTSWQPGEEWYQEATGLKGHYYHEHVIIPKLMLMIKSARCESILDLACGPGVLGRAIDQNIFYCGFFEE